MLSNGKTIVVRRGWDRRKFGNTTSLVPTFPYLMTITQNTVLTKENSAQEIFIRCCIQISGISVTI